MLSECLDQTGGAQTAGMPLMPPPLVRHWFGFHQRRIRLRSCSRWRREFAELSRPEPSHHGPEMIFDSNNAVALLTPAAAGWPGDRPSAVKRSWSRSSRTRPR
jgi:hypothetical protein